MESIGIWAGSHQSLIRSNLHALVPFWRYKFTSTEEKSDVREAAWKIARKEKREKSQRSQKGLQVAKKQRSQKGLQVAHEEKLSLLNAWWELREVFKL